MSEKYKAIELKLDTVWRRKALLRRHDTCVVTRFRYAVLILAWFFSSFAAAAQDKAELESPSAASSPSRSELSALGYRQVAQSEELRLFVDDTTGFLAVAAGDSLWFSSPPNWEADTVASGFNKNGLPSLLSITTKDQFGGIFPANSWINVVRRSGLSIEALENGIRLIHSFEREGIIIPVDAYLSDGALVLSVNLEEIWEDPESDLQILDFTLAPYFGAAAASEEGYMFVPDGCGALIGFTNQNSSEPYRQYVYGRDPSIIPAMKKSVTETIRLPVFGLTRSMGGLFAVIEAGAARAYLNAETAFQKSTFNTINAACVVRDFDVATFREKTGTPRDIRIFERGNFEGESFTLRYFFLPKEKSDYVAMAETYRAYLQDRNRFPLALDAGDPQLFIGFIGGGVKTKPVLGIPTDTLVAYTPFDDARRIIESLESKGVDDFIIKYEGWVKGGLYRDYPASAKPADELGGTAGFKRLQTWLEEKAFDFYPSVDPVILYRPSLSRLKELTTNRAINRAPAALRQYYLTTFAPLDGAQSYWTLRTSIVEKSYQNFLTSLAKFGNIGLAPDTLGFWVGSDFVPRNGTSRIAAAESWDGLLKKTAMDRHVALSRPLDYGLAHASFLSDLPTVSSRFDIEDEAIPFYQILVRGYIPFSNLYGNRDLDLESYKLRLLETGALPSYLLLARHAEDTRNSALASFMNVLADDWMDEAAHVYAEVAPFLRSIAGQAIVEHRVINGGLRFTRYANGSKVFVNYSSVDLAAPDGGIVPAGGYVLLIEGAR